MKLIDLLLYQIGQLKISTTELQEAENIRDRAALLAELRSYHRLLDSTIERLENDHFRRDPKTLLQRSFLCYNPEKDIGKDQNKPL